MPHVARVFIVQPAVLAGKDFVDVQHAGHKQPQRLGNRNHLAERRIIGLRLADDVLARQHHRPWGTVIPGLTRARCNTIASCATLAPSTWLLKPVNAAFCSPATASRPMRAGPVTRAVGQDHLIA